MALSQQIIKALKLINEFKILYVFPAKNKKTTSESLWNLLHPRSIFSWKWDETADPKVVRLWWLKDELARSQKALYGRFFSNQPCFVSLDHAMKNKWGDQNSDDFEGNNDSLEKAILDSLASNSPQTKRMLKKIIQVDIEAHTKYEWNKAFEKLQRKKLICNLGDSERENSFMPSTEYGFIPTIFESQVGT